jgi:hypothetical protein
VQWTDGDDGDRPEQRLIERLTTVQPIRVARRTQTRAGRLRRRSPCGASTAAHGNKVRACNSCRPVSSISAATACRARLPVPLKWGP